MENNEWLLYEIPRGLDIKDLRRIAEQVLGESQNDIVEILCRSNLSPEQAAAAAQKIIQSPPTIDYDASGNVAEVVAIVVSLTPLIKALLEPFAKRGAELAHQVGKDIWAMQKRKMLANNIRLAEKRPRKRSG